jgi:hypothetical protein
MGGLPASRQTNNKLKALSAILTLRRTLKLSAEYCGQLRCASAGAGLVCSGNAQLQVLGSIPSAGSVSL